MKKISESLHFLKMKELREVASRLGISGQGKKGQLISCILYFIKTGKEQTALKLPDISCAQKGYEYPLKPTTKILKGAYKNDLQTRLFFKKLIGEHFHFTAFGNDWLQERWIAGNPPTYKEFAIMWQREIDRRKKNQVEPKAEWAYITFVQDYTKKYPNYSRDQLVQAWENERLKHKKRVKIFLQDFTKKR